MPELEKQLKQFPTFTQLQEVEAELSANKNPQKINVNDPEQLRAQLERIENRKKIDKTAAVSAFRLEVASAEESALPIIEKLAVLAAYDPVVVKRHAANNKQTNDRMSLAGKHGVRRYSAMRARSMVSLTGVEGNDDHIPLYAARDLVDAMTRVSSFVDDNSGEEIAIRLHDKNLITGTLPSIEQSFPLVQPTIDANGQVTYHLPAELTDVSNLRLYTPEGARRLHVDDISLYPHILDKKRGDKVIAKPGINDIRQELGLLGVNVFRSYFRDSFDEAITSEEDGIRPEKPQLRRRVRRGDTLLR